MIVSCPNCGNPVVVNGLGRKKLNITLINIIECLQKYRNVKKTAQELKCSQAYIFNLLKKNGLRLKDVVKK